MDSAMIQTLTMKLSDVTTRNRRACSCRKKHARSNLKAASNCPHFLKKQDEQTIMHGGAPNLNERKSYYFSGMELVLRGCTANNQSETRLTKEDLESWWNGDEEDSIDICKRQRSRRATARRTTPSPVDSLRWNIDGEEDSIKYSRKTRTVVTTESFCCAE